MTRRGSRHTTPHLGEARLQVLLALRVAGQPLSVGDLSGLVRQPPAEVAAHLDHLEAGGQIRRVAGASGDVVRWSGEPPADAGDFRAAAAVRQHVAAASAPRPPTSPMRKRAAPDPARPARALPQLSNARPVIRRDPLLAAFFGDPD